MKNLNQRFSFFEDFQAILYKRLSSRGAKEGVCVFLTRVTKATMAYYLLCQLGKPSKEKTGNILVFYQSGVPPPPPFSEDW